MSWKKRRRVGRRTSILRRARSTPSPPPPLPEALRANIPQIAKSTRS